MTLVLKWASFFLMRQDQTGIDHDGCTQIGIIYLLPIAEPAGLAVKVCFSISIMKSDRRSQIWLWGIWFKK
jgi:hypothetical protein